MSQLITKLNMPEEGDDLEVVWMRVIAKINEIIEVVNENTSNT